MLKFLKSSLCIFLTAIMLIGCASNTPTVYRDAPSPKQTESSKESSSAAPIIFSVVILGLMTSIVFIAGISSNGPNDWKDK
jgi:hypothetical protein